MDLEELDEDEKPKQPKFPLNMYISEGNKYLRLRMYDKAIASFDAALVQSPCDLRSLVGRTKCYIRHHRYAEAKEDAETILNSYPKSAEGMMLFGEINYRLGNFEKAFLSYYNSHRIRPNCKGLRLGYQLCQSAIDDFLADDDSLAFSEGEVEKMETLLDRKSEYKSQKDTKKLFKNLSDIRSLSNLRDRSSHGIKLSKISIFAAVLKKNHQMCLQRYRRLFTDMMVDDEEEEKKKPKYPKSLHLSEGYRYFNMRQYEKAISYLNTSLTLYPENEKTLLGLAKCYFRLGKFDDAKKYVETILKRNSKSADAVYLDATVSYLLGDFETSFLTFWRGFSIHFNRKDLRLGHQSCENAINNSLDSYANLFLDEFDVEEVDKLLHDHQQRTGEKFCTKRAEPHSIKKDLKFVKTLMEDEMVDIVHSDCKELLDYLNGRQKFWNIHSPNLERMPLKPKVPTSIRKDELKKLGPDALGGMIKNKYSECKEALKDGDIDDSLKLALEILAILGILSSERFTDNALFKAQIFQLIGLAYMLKKDFMPALIYFSKQLKIGMGSNSPVCQLKALLGIGEIFFKSKNYEAALECYDWSLPFIETKREESFVLYKMADCQIHLDPQVAEENAMKSLEISKALQDTKLQLDVMLLLGEISVKCKDMQKAHELFSKALTVAIECDDPRQDSVKNLVDMFDRKSSSERLLHKILRLHKFYVKAENVRVI